MSSSPSPRAPSRPAPSSSRTWIALFAVVALSGGALGLSMVAPARSETSAAIRPEPAAPEGPLTLADASRRVPIEVYTADWCGSCQRAKAWMHQHDVAFTEVDIDRRAGAREQLRALNPQGSIPTFDVAGTVLVGFDASRLTTTIDGAARR